MSDSQIRQPAQRRLERSAFDRKRLVRLGIVLAAVCLHGVRLDAGPERGEPVRGAEAFDGHQGRAEVLRIETSPALADEAAVGLGEPFVGHQVATEQVEEGLDMAGQCVLPAAAAGLPDCQDEGETGGADAADETADGGGPEGFPVHEPAPPGAWTNLLLMLTFIVSFMSGVFIAYLIVPWAWDKCHGDAVVDAWFDWRLDRRLKQINASLDALKKRTHPNEGNER